MRRQAAGGEEGKGSCCCSAPLRRRWRRGMQAAAAAVARRCKKHVSSVLPPNPSKCNNLSMNFALAQGRGKFALGNILLPPLQPPQLSSALPHRFSLPQSHACCVRRVRCSSCSLTSPACAACSCAACCKPPGAPSVPPLHLPLSSTFSFSFVVVC